MKTPWKTTDTSTGSIASYSIGFLLSFSLTIISFWIAPHLGGLAALCITAGALLQLGVQLVFFLHMGRTKDSGWNIGIGMLAVTIIGILIGGTLWIMNNLAHLHMHSPTTTDLYENGVVAPQNELK